MQERSFPLSTNRQSDSYIIYTEKTKNRQTRVTVGFFSRIKLTILYVLYDDELQARDVRF